MRQHRVNACGRSRRIGAGSKGIDTEIHATLAYKPPACRTPDHATHASRRPPPT
jgi:hypothetical protein